MKYFDVCLESCKTREFDIEFHVVCTCNSVFMNLGLFYLSVPTDILLLIKWTYMYLSMTSPKRLQIMYCILSPSYNPILSHSSSFSKSILDTQ